MNRRNACQLTHLALACLLVQSANASDVDPAESTLGPAFRMIDAIDAAEIVGPVLRQEVRFDELPVTPTRPVSAINGENTVAWVQATALADDDVRTELHNIYRSGMPVLITHPDNDLPNEHAAFISATLGAASMDAAAYYRREDDGALGIFSAHASPDDPENFKKALAYAQAALASPSRRATELQANTPHAELPRFNVRNSVSSPTGSAISHDTTVLRDTSDNVDRKVVVSSASHIIIPELNGLFPDLLVKKLVVPNKYNLHQALDTGPGFTATLDDRAPESNGSTDFVVNERKSRKVSFSASVKPELSGALGTQGVNPTGKIAGALTIGTDFEHESTVNFSVKDYRIGTSSSTPGQATWQLSLADVISSDGGYFGRPPSLKKVTPMMHQASAQTYVSWSGSGTYEGNMVLATSASIVNATYRLLGLPALSEDPGRQSPSQLMIDASIPYLERWPVVLIQSNKSNGGCMVDFDGLLQMRACRSDPSFRAEQWVFDAEGRYRNRGTGRCLTAHIETGKAVTETCRLSNDQRWAWQANRIHSALDASAPGWRLHVEGDDLMAQTNPAIHDSYPINPSHALLNPWTDYPDAPTARSFIPTLIGWPAPVPESWYSLRAPTTEEQWTVTHVRQGI